MEISIIRNANGRYSAHIEQLHASTQGETRDELITNITKCIDFSVKCMRSEFKNKKIAEEYITLSSSPRFYLNMEHLFDANYA